MESWFFNGSNLTLPDYLVVVGSIAVLFIIGFLSGRKDDTTQNFFLGSRKIPMWAACLSFVATEISAVTIISVPSTAFKENWMYLQLFIGSFCSRIFLAMFFIPAFYKFNCTTIYEYLKHRFGPQTQVTATLFFFVTRLMGSAVRLTVASTAVSVLLGWNLIPTLIFFSVVSMLYISWGGIKAIIWTNVWQTTTFVIGAITTIYFIAHVIPGGLPAIFHTAAEAGKTKVFDWGLNISDPNFFHSIVSNPNIWWLAILNGFFGSVAAFGTDHELMQRLLTVETRKKSQKTTLATPLVGFSVLMLYLTIGCCLYAFYQYNTTAVLPQKLDDIYPHFVNTQMPAVLRGIILSVVIMASIDSPLGSLTASFVTDFYKPVVRKEAPDAHYLKVARIMVIVFGIILGLLAFQFSRLEGFLWWAFKIGGVTYGSLLGVFLLGLFTEAQPKKTHLIGMVVMSLVNLTLLILTEQKILVVGWTWLVLIGTFGTFAFGYIGARFEKK